MTTINKTNAAPSFLKRVNSSGTELSSLKQLLFYLPGGKDIISIEMLDNSTYNVFVPLFSSIVYNDVGPIVIGLLNEIKAGMRLRGINAKQPFLFDTVKKIVLTEESFTNWIPFYSIKTALFKEKGEDAIMYLGDSTDYGALQAASVLMAKQRLFKPTNGQWSQEGKVLLNFMVSRQYKIRTTFNSINGGWNNVIYSFNKDDFNPLSTLSNLRIDKAMELSAKLIDKINHQNSAYPGDGEDSLFLLPDQIMKDTAEFGGDEDYRLCLLSDLLNTGIKHYLLSGDYGVIQAEIDINKDLFEEILIDCVGGTVYVKLSPNAKMSIDSTADALQVDNVTLVDSNASLYNLLSSPMG